MEVLNINDNFLKCLECFKHMNIREKKDTNISRTIAHLKNKGVMVPPTSCFIEFFQLLEKSGFGELRKNGAYYEFLWTEKNQLKELIFKYLENNIVVSQSSSMQSLIAYSFPLRKDIKIKLDVPEDFNGEDLIRINKFLETLIFK